MVPAYCMNRISAVNKHGLVEARLQPDSVELNCNVFLFHWLGGMFKLHRVAQPDG